MKAWHAALAALVGLVPQASTAADDLPGAARELARRTSGVFRGPVKATYYNLSFLPDSELVRVRREFEAAMPASAEGEPPAEAHLTLSENASQFLLVEEIRRGEESQVWIATWKRSERAAVSVSGLTLEKRLIWEQSEPILDASILEDGLVILSPSGITIHREQREVTSPFTPGKPWPRDPRGRLRVVGGRIQAFLPGMTCEDSLAAAPSLRCQANDEPWVLESGRAILLGNFASDRNYFDGRVVAQNGVPKSVAPFYSAAAAEEQGTLWWLLALLDGRTQVLDNALAPVATFSGWGSDVVGISARCGGIGGSQVLATRPGDANEPDAIQAFTLTNHMPVALGPAVTFAGPVTALWPSGSTAALAVARDTSTGKYGAYVLSIVCGP